MQKALWSHVTTISSYSRLFGTKKAAQKVRQSQTCAGQN